MEKFGLVGINEWAKNQRKNKKHQKDDFKKIEFSNQVIQQNQFPIFDSLQGRRITVIDRVDMPKEDYDKIINENEKLKRENQGLVSKMKKYC